MENTDKMYLTLMFTIVVAFVGGILLPSPIQATGGGEVIKLVIPILDEATKAVQEGDNEKALTLLDEIKTELKDTFFAEEEN